MISIRNIKILYIITLSNLGGAQVHLFDLISHLPKYVIPFVAIGEKGWLYKELQKQGIKVFYVKSLVREISPVKEIQTILTLRHIMHGVKPDIVHCHSSKAGFLGRIAAKICHIPAVFTAHGWAFTEGVSPKKRLLYKVLENMAAKWTEKIICVSDYDRQLGLKVISDSANKLVTIHNGVENFPRKYRKLNSIESERLRLIMVARFSSPKDHELLLNALAILQKKGIPFETTLIGDGPKLESSKILACKLGINEEVYFAGARSDVEELLAKQDIFILTSKWEGFPISILEAMRQGLPVVASDVGGVNEAVIDGETGFLVPRGSVDCLVKYLKELHENIELRKKMGIRARTRFEQYFTVESMVQKILEVYEEIIKRNII